MAESTEDPKTLPAAEPEEANPTAVLGKMFNKPKTEYVS